MDAERIVDQIIAQQNAYAFRIHLMKSLGEYFRSLGYPAIPLDFNQLELDVYINNITVTITIDANDEGWVIMPPRPKTRPYKAIIVPYEAPMEELIRIIKNSIEE